MNFNDFNLLKNKRFLVTGGAGFIGSNIVDVLIKMGNIVRVLDNFSTGKWENIYAHLNNNLFELIVGDIRDIETCRKACEGIDYVLHQAALGGVTRSILYPKETNDVNITGTINMFVAARDQGIKRFVYASSSSVYGDEKNLIKEEKKTGKPLSPYAVSKRANELYAKNFYDLYKLQCIGLRYFNVFGKRQNPNSIYAAVIPTFIKKLIDNESPIIDGDGMQSRDFTYIENVIEANLKACVSGVESYGEVFNIAYGERTSIIDLFKKLCELIGKDIKPTFGPRRIGDIMHTNADISLARRVLGYNPKYDINKGLELTTQWYKHYILY